MQPTLSLSAKGKQNIPLAENVRSSSGSTTNWESPAKIHRLNARNGISRLTDVEKQDIQTRITAQAEAIRGLKLHGIAKSDPMRFWNEVFALLELKYRFNIDLQTPDCPPEFVCPMQHEKLRIDLKVRWSVRGPDGKVVRLQRPFQNCTTVTGAQIRRVIVEHTHKVSQYPDVGRFLKIEYPSSLASMTLIVTQTLDDGTIVKIPKNLGAAALPSGGPRSWTALMDKDVFRLPLWFPGPKLPNRSSLEFRVTFPEPSSNLSTPLMYEKLSQLPELVDCGVNLFAPEFENEGCSVVINRAVRAGVAQLVLLSVDLASCAHSLKWAELHVRTAYAVIGVHPEYCRNADLCREMDELRNLLATHHDAVVGIGECGLDFSKVDRNLEEQKIQLQWFEQQLAWAAEVQLPVFVHEKSAFRETLDMLESYCPRLPAVCINCFAGTEKELRSYVNHGFYIVITGKICNDKNVALRDLLKLIPQDRLLLGSDAPYLTPFNMERPFPSFNEPCTLPHVAVMVSECLNLPVQQIASVTCQNARRLFAFHTTCYDGRHGLRPYPFQPNAFFGFAGQSRKAPNVQEMLAAALKPGEVVFGPFNGEYFAFPESKTDTPRRLDALWKQDMIDVASLREQLVAAKEGRLLSFETYNRKRKKEKKMKEKEHKKRFKKGSKKSKKGPGGSM